MLIGAVTDDQRDARAIENLRLRRTEKQAGRDRERCRRPPEYV